MISFVLLFSSLGWQLYMEHYEREFPSLFLSHSGTHNEEDLEEMEDDHMTAPGGVAIPLHPPSLMHWLHQRLWGKQVREREREKYVRYSHSFFSNIIFHCSLHLSLCCQLCAREQSLYWRYMCVHVNYHDLHVLKIHAIVLLQRYLKLNIHACTGPYYYLIVTGSFCWWDAFFFPELYSVQNWWWRWAATRPDLLSTGGRWEWPGGCRSVL